MIITQIVYARKFVKQLKKLPADIIKIAIAKEKLFKVNPLHPSLRLHELQGKLAGLWFITLTRNFRIIFKRQPNGDILFIFIGKHDIYREL